MSIFDLSEQEIIRRNSLNELRKMGIEPYPAAEYKVNAYTEEMKASFSDDAEPRQVSIDDIVWYMLYLAILLYQKRVSLF